MNEIKERELEYLKQYYQDRSVKIYAMAEYAGIPSIITGKDSKSYVDIFANQLIEENINVEQVLKLQSLFFNKATFINHMLEHNPTIADLKRLLITSVDATRKDLLTSIAVRDSVKKNIIIHPEEETKRICDDIRESKDTIVFRSSTGNDIMYHIHADFVSYLFASKEKKEATINFMKDPNTIKKIISDIRKNYQNLYEINPDISIFEMGIEKPLIISDNYVKEFLQRIKWNLRQLAESYQVHYIDGETLEKNIFRSQISLADDVIAKLANEKVKGIQKDIPTKEHITTDSGLAGMLEEAELGYRSYLSVDNTYLSNYEKKVIIEKKLEYLRGIEAYHDAIYMKKR